MGLSEYLTGARRELPGGTVLLGQKRGRCHVVLGRVPPVHKDVLAVFDPQALDLRGVCLVLHLQQNVILPYILDMRSLQGFI